MKTIHVVTACAMLVTLGCGQAAKEKYSEESKAVLADSVATGQLFSSSAAVENKKDSLRKFIRTADLKFRVANVQRSTYAIEDIAVHSGGFVTLSDLACSVNAKTSTKISEDSLLETTYFVTTNTLSMRVPNENLDTVLKQIAKQISFLDHRTIKAEDVSLQFMANKWTQHRAVKHYARLKKAIDEKGKKLSEINEAEENLASKEELADFHELDNISLTDRINYSTINILIYQREETKKEVVANETNIREYEPGFLYKAKEALKGGWLFLQGLALFLLAIWPIYPIGIILWIVIRKYFWTK